MAVWGTLATYRFPARDELTDELKIVEKHVENNLAWHQLPCAVRKTSREQLSRRKTCFFCGTFDDVLDPGEVTVESRLKYLEQMLGDSEAKHQEEPMFSNQKNASHICIAAYPERVLLCWKTEFFFGEMISQISWTSISRECGHVTIWYNAMWYLYKQGQLSCLSCKTAGFGIFLEELKNAHGQLQALHGRLGNLEVCQCHPVPLSSCVSWHVATCHAVQDAGNPGRREGSSWRVLCRNCMGIDS